MKAVFIAFDQAHLEMIQSILDHHNCRGFSYWENIQGRGSVKVNHIMVVMLGQV